MSLLLQCIRLYWHEKCSESNSSYLFLSLSLTYSLSLSLSLSHTHNIPEKSKFSATKDYFPKAPTLVMQFCQQWTRVSILSVLKFTKLFASMWHKAEWMGHPMSLEFTRVGLLVKLAKNYNTRGAQRNTHVRESLRKIMQFFPYKQ